jgi:hypothetical protein
MPTQINLKQILKDNPQVDAQFLKSVRKLRKQVRKFRTAGTGYKLALPFERRQAITGRNENENDRVTRLRTSR